MKDFYIDGKRMRVFVLAETDTRLVYIPISNKILTQYDYQVIKQLDDQGGDLMKKMRDHKLDNGCYALSLYDSMIQVMNINGHQGSIPSGVRIPKPEEEVAYTAAKGEAVEIHRPESLFTPPQVVDQPQQVDNEVKPARKKPGPKPGSRKRGTPTS